MEMLIGLMFFIVGPILVSKYSRNPNFGMTWKTDVEGIRRVDKEWNLESVSKTKISNYGEA